MEFTITKENFLQGLSKTQGVVDRKGTMPVLSNVLLDVGKNGLKIVATDLEVCIVTQVPAQVAKLGKMTVSARRLHDIVREIEAPEIKVAQKDNDRVEIRAGTSHFVIPGLAAGEFPTVPSVEGKSVEIPCEAFLRMIERTAFSIAADETRQHLMGVLLHRNTDGKLRMVATDGHRLSLVDGDLVESLGDVKVIIPRKGIGELKRLLSGDGSFEFAVGEKGVFARKGNDSLYIRLIDGEFPDYRRVVPEKAGKVARVPRERFIGALRRVSLLSNERSRGVLLQVSPAHMSISVNNPDMGEAHEEFDVDYKGESLTVGFNARYFLDALEVMTDDTVLVGLNTDLSPCVLRPSKEDSFLCVIMPMRI